MKPVFQTLFGGPSAPPEEQGNCLQACLASLFELDLDAVPHFVGLYQDEGWFDAMQEWLKDRYALGAMTVICNEENFPRGLTLMGGKAIPSGIEHVVVFQEGKQVHNPLGPHSEIEPEVYWVFYSLDPSQHTGPDLLEGMYILATGDWDGEV